MKFTRISNNKAVAVKDLNSGDTVLFNNAVCMAVSINNGTFLVDLKTGCRACGAELATKVVPIECELIFKVI